MHTLQSPHSPLLQQHGQLLSMQVQHPHALHGGGGGHNNGLRGIPLGVPNGFQVAANQAGHPQALGQGQHLMHASAGLAHGMHGASNGTFGSFSSIQQVMSGGATEYGGQGGAHPNPNFPKFVRPQPQSKVPQPTSVPRTDDCIRDVWAHNLEDEMRRISDIVERYPFISMDTEFPGVVVHPLQSGNYAGSNFSHMWKTIQCNVNILKIIQLGLTFSDEHGRVPDGVCTWQFNFKFDIDLDMYAQDSIELLQASGLDFAKHSSDGIDVHSFGELLTASGLVLNEEVRWVSFHSGYDFGYIIRVLTNAELPEDESEFFELLDMYFNCVYDIKYVVKSCSELNHKAGLNQLAADLLIERIGPCHQAGSDSLITCLSFFKMIKNYATDFSLEDAKWKNVLYGLGRDNL